MGRTRFEPALVLWLWLLLLTPHSLVAGETLYNGIQLPDNWPPEIRHMDDGPMAVPYLQSPPSVIPIDVGRQLFVDSFLIESSTLSQQYHPATVHKKPVLVPDKPWEVGTDSNPPTAMTFSGGVWFDAQEKLYKMWYSAGFNQAVGYATSTNGVTWTKPNLDVVPGTNLVYSGAHDSSTVWLDQNAAAPSQRFKMMLRDNASGQQQIRYSEDGIHWSDVVTTTGAAFDRSTFFHNPFRDKWVMSIRGDGYNPETETVGGSFDGRAPFDGGGGIVSLPRLRRYAEGDTLAEAAQSWPTTTYSSPEWWQNTTVPTMWVGADNLDLPRPDRGITPELYNLDSVAYESVMAGMFSIWHGARTESPDRDKINNIKVGFSRDGFHWDRTNRTPIIDVSEDPEAWHYSNVQSAGGTLLTVGDQLYIYTSGRQGRFEGVSSTGLSTMRRDGFTSMVGGDEGGTLTTRPVEFSGKYLFVNADAIGGQLQAEILDQHGNVIEQFSREKSVVFSSDSTSAQFSWDGISDLSGLAGQPVKFRFYSTNSALYSFWVSPDASGASYGYVAAGGPGFTSSVDTVGMSGMAQVSLPATADATISNRPDLRALNAGHQTKLGIGTGGELHDNGVALVRFDLTDQQGREALGNGKLTLRQVLGENAKNFDGQTLDLYAMPAENANWEEGTGQMSEVDGVAWNRKSGPFSTSPLDANKWLPNEVNDPTAGIRLIDSIVWDENAGQGHAVFTIPTEELNQWLSIGYISLLIRSNSAEALLAGGDLTQRTWYMATRQTGDGARAARLAFTTAVPEPSGLTLLMIGTVGLSAIRRK
jgi:hypothetical protein